MALSTDRTQKALNVVTLLYVASVPWDLLPVAFGRTLTPPITLIFLFMWIVCALRDFRIIRLPRLAGLFLALYLIWATLTAFWSIDPTVSLSTIGSVFPQAVMAVVLSNALGAVWLWSLATIGCSASIIGLIVLRNPLDPTRSDRANIAGVDENYTAMILAVGLAAIIYFAFHMRGRVSFLCLMPAFIIGLAILHTGSRSGAVALIAVIFVGLLGALWSTGVQPMRWLQLGLVGLVAFFAFGQAVSAGIVPPSSPRNIQPIRRSYRRRKVRYS